MKKLLIVFLSFFCIVSVSASTKTYPRTSDSNYGVNKNWNIDSGNIANVNNTPLVDASEKIYDFADILSDSEEKEIYQYIINFINKTKMDMVFVSIDMPYGIDSMNEDFAADFYDYNDFGLDFDKYSGVLLLRNNYDRDRYYNIYTFGEAQRYFSYSRLESILDDIYDDFVSKDYLSGIKKFVNRCSSYYDSGIPYNMRGYYVTDDGFLKKVYRVPIFGCLFGSLIITLIVIFILVKKNKMVKRALMAKDYLDKSSVSYSVSNDTFITSHTSSYTVSSSSGGGGSRGGSSGGGHSSGGGRHG